MLYIFIGLFFVFIDWPIPLLSGSFDVAPNAIGYLLALYGAHTLKHESKHFRDAFFVSIALLAVSVAQAVLSLLGFVATSIPLAAVSVLSTLAFLFFAHELTKGAKEMEARRNRPLGASKLLTAWGFLCIGSLMAYLPLLMPDMFLTASLVQLLSYFWFEYSLYLIYSKAK